MYTEYELRQEVIVGGLSTQLVLPDGTTLRQLLRYLIEIKLEGLIKVEPGGTIGLKAGGLQISADIDFTSGIMDSEVYSAEWLVPTSRTTGEVVGQTVISIRLRRPPVIDRSSIAYEVMAEHGVSFQPLFKVLMFRDMSLKQLLFYLYRVKFDRVEHSREHVHVNVYDRASDQLGIGTLRLPVTREPLWLHEVGNNRVVMALGTYAEATRYEGRKPAPPIKSIEVYIERNKY